MFGNKLIFDLLRLNFVELVVRLMIENDRCLNRDFFEDVEMTFFNLLLIFFFK